MGDELTIQTILNILEKTSNALDDVEKRLRTQSLIVGGMRSDLIDLRKASKKLESKVFSGNGGYSLTTEVALLSQELEDIKERQDSINLMHQSDIKELRDDIKTAIKEEHAKHNKIIVAVLGLIGVIVSAITQLL